MRWRDTVIARHGSCLISEKMFLFVIIVCARAAALITIVDGYADDANSLRAV